MARRLLRPVAGFTMIEMVVVMALVGLLLSVAVPFYMGTLERGREKVLQHNLAQLRQAIDRYRGDRGVFPERLEDLVEKRYLRAVPLNPYTEQADWDLVAPPSGQPGNVYDVRARPGTTGDAEREPAAAVAAPAASAASAAETEGGR